MQYGYDFRVENSGSGLFSFVSRNSQDFSGIDPGKVGIFGLAGCVLGVI